MKDEAKLNKAKLDNNTNIKVLSALRDNIRIISDPGQVNIVYAEVIKKTGSNELPTDDFKEIANKDEQFKPLMYLVKLLPNIPVKSMPVSCARGLFKAYGTSSHRQVSLQIKQV